MKRILFLDRDGVILREPPTDFQVDALEKLAFVPGAITALSKIATELDFYKVLITNQDGLGSPAFPEEKFQPLQDLMIRTLEGEGFCFDEVHIDRSLPEQNLPTRKPGIGLVQHLLDKDADLSQSFVIGDRWTDLQLAQNLGCKAIFLQALHPLSPEQRLQYADVLVLETTSWNEIYAYLRLGSRKIVHQRTTNETQIAVELDVDGSGQADIDTGLGFFNHMLEQIARHGNMDLRIKVQGDLQVDEHHTIEDTGIALGEAFAKALADKRGMERYGFALPMDDAEAKVLIDFGGRSWLVWQVEFRREKIGDVPTEMFEHFFRSFADAARCNLNIACAGQNEHHKIEAVFKAFARSIRLAVRRNPHATQLPTTKGVI